MDIGVRTRKLVVYYAIRNSSRISRIALQENPRYMRIKFKGKEILVRKLNDEEERWYGKKE